MRRVVVSGIGAVTPLGGDIKSTWENLVKNKSGANLISKFDTSDFQTKISCEVPLKIDQNSSESSFDSSKWFSPKDLRNCLLYTSPSPRDRSVSRMPSSA